MNASEPVVLAGLVIWGTGALMWCFAYIWIIVKFFQIDHAWAITSLALPPLVYMYGLLRWDLVEKPMVILIVALLIALLGADVVKFEQGLLNSWEYLVPLPIPLSTLKTL